MKNIVYLHQYFQFPDEGGATRSYWFVKGLIKAGYKVLVISSIHDRCSRSPGRYEFDGIEVEYLDIKYSNRMNKREKVNAFISFFIGCMKVMRKELNIDLVYATSTPLTVGIPALYFRIFHRTKYIFEVRDLWPDFPIAIGAIRNKIIIFFLKLLERCIYLKSEHIVALSPGMKDGVIKTGIRTEKVSVIPNMSKPDLFYPRQKNNALFSKYQELKAPYTIVHFGTMGPANGLDYFIDAAHVMSSSQNQTIKFILIGGGSEEERLKALVETKKLKNVVFRGYMNTFDISDYINCCDVSFVSFADLPILQTNSPNKLFDSFAAGKPVIVNSAGWTKTLVEEFNCGFYVDPKNPMDLATKIQELEHDSHLSSRMAQNSRMLAISKFNREKLVNEFLEIVAKVV
jgi:glycosyltransferase involved in cell wall biosynthesis